jgi:hypothetical protein
LLQNKILTPNCSKNLNFNTEDDVPVGKLRKKYEKIPYFLHPQNQ